MYCQRDHADWVHISTDMLLIYLLNSLPHSRAEIKLAFEAKKFESRQDGRVEVWLLFNL